MKDLSVSVSHGRVALKHDQREYVPENVNEDLMKNNVYIKTCSDLETEFNELFADDVAKYNATVRSDRKIGNYYQKVKANEGRKNTAKTAYEYVFQIGNMENNNVNDPNFKEVNEETKLMLIEFERRFREKYPCLHIASSVVHMDEQTPHLHMAVIPYATGYKNGMQHQCSLTKAFNNMGFKNKTLEINGKKTQILAVKQWQDDVKELMEDVMEEYGYSRENMGNTNEHKNVSTYKLEKRAEEVKKAEENVKEAEERNRVKTAERMKAEDDFEMKKSAFEDEKAEYIEKKRKFKKTINAVAKELGLEEKSKTFNETFDFVLNEFKSIKSREATVEERERRCGLKESLDETVSQENPTVNQEWNSRLQNTQSVLGM